MCILLKFDYAKYGVTNVFFQKLSKKNLWDGWGGRLDPPHGKGRVKIIFYVPNLPPVFLLKDWLM